MPGFGRDARAAESARLESVCGATHRGFESHSLRSAVVDAQQPDADLRRISVDDADGFFEPEDLDGYRVNSITATEDADGTMTIRLGRTRRRASVFNQTVDNGGRGAYVSSTIELKKEVVDGRRPAVASVRGARRSDPA